MRFILCYHPFSLAYESHSGISLHRNVLSLFSFNSANLMSRHVWWWIKRMLFHKIIFNFDEKWNQQLWACSNLYTITVRSGSCLFAFIQTRASFQLEIVKQHHQHVANHNFFCPPPFSFHFYSQCSIVRSNFIDLFGGISVRFLCSTVSLLLHHHNALNVIDSQKWRKISKKIPRFNEFVSLYDMIWYDIIHIFTVRW